MRAFTEYAIIFLTSELLLSLPALPIPESAWFPNILLFSYVPMPSLMSNDLKHIYSLWSHLLILTLSILGMFYIVGLNSCLVWMVPPEFYKFGL